MATFRATVSAASCPLALVVCLSAALEAAPRQPAEDPPVSLDRIREALVKTPTSRLKVDMPVQLPVARFRTGVNQRIYVLTLDEWLEKQFKLSALQRQSADWAAKCCGGYVLGSVRLDPLFTSLEQALQRRRVRKIRERIAEELAALEAARKKAGLPDEP